MISAMPHPDEHLPASRPLAPGEAERVAELMAAFTVASRVRLLYALLTGEAHVDELAARTGMTPNAVSQQLRVLRHLRMVIACRVARTASVPAPRRTHRRLVRGGSPPRRACDRRWEDDVVALRAPSRAGT